MVKYRDYEIDVQPGMCCPEIRIRRNGVTIERFPHDEPHASGMRKAESIIDGFYDSPSKFDCGECATGCYMVCRRRTKTPAPLREALEGE